MTRSRLASVACAVLAVAVLGGAAPAGAASPGTWLRTSALSLPSYYRQGLASNPATGDVFFSGAFAGIYRTRNGSQVAANTNPIPADVAQREQYNHIGDIAFDTAEGGRVLLPLESYTPFQPDTNPSKTGSIGVMDAATLRWKYYVKLDPAEIPKAQWIATDPARGLFWTITGSDLLAYRLSDLSPANAAPAAAPIHSVQRLAGVAPNGAGGAVVIGNRIYMSTQTGGVDQVVSVDLTTGSSRVEIEAPGTAEPEGLDTGPYLGGFLHWGLVPGGGLSNTKLLSFVPKGSRLSLELRPSRICACRRAIVRATAAVRVTRYEIPLAGVQIRIAGKVAKTGANGRAKLTLKLTRGRYRAEAFYRGLRSAVVHLRVT